MSYGPSITIESAKKAAAAAIEVARANGWAMAVAIVDTAGLLVYSKMDDTQLGSVRVAPAKAAAAALFKRPTRALQEALAGGGDGLRVLALEGAVPVEGGIPLVSGGKIVGAIGLSGGTSAQDGQCAQAGVDALAV